MQVSSMVSSGEKIINIICYKRMNFLIKNAEYLEKYTDIWIKANNIIKKENDCQPIYI